MKNLTAHLDAYTPALATLQRLGFDTSDITKQHAVMLREHDAAQPTALDLQWQLSTPESWHTHFEQTKKVGDVVLTEGGVAPIFSTSTCRVGAQFSLTKGQRNMMRGYGMTPTRYVEVIDLELFPSTRAVRMITFKSCLHVPEHKRKHVLFQVTITDFAKFMQSAKDIDNEDEDVKAERDESKRAKAEKVDKTLTAALAAQYI